MPALFAFLSICPTARSISWSGSLKQGKLPDVSGESRLLRAVAGLELQGGRIRLDGTEQSEVSAHRWRRSVILVPAESAWWFDAVGEHLHRPMPEALRAPGFEEETANWSLSRLASGEKQRRNADLTKVMHLHYLCSLLNSPSWSQPVAKPVMTSESTLTDRYQTTVPEPVRKALHLQKREKIRYTINADGSVLISRADEDLNDPALNPFLSFLAKDIRENPERLGPLDPELFQRVRSLVEGVEVDLDCPLPDEDE